MDLLSRLPLGSQRVEAEPRWRRTDYKGVTITYLPSGAGTSLAWAIVGDAAVLGSSVAEVQGAVDLSGDGGGIDQAPGFTAATLAVPSGDGVLYVDVQAALTGIRAQLDPSAQASFDEQIKNLAPISTVVMGFSNDASSQHIRVLVRIP